MENLIERFVENQKWSKITAVLFIVMFGVQVLSALMNIGMGAAGIGSALLGLLIGVFLYLLPGLSLLSYCKHITVAETHPLEATGSIEEACRQQSKYFKYLGVVSLIFIVLFVIAIIAAISIPAYQGYIMGM